MFPNEFRCSSCQTTFRAPFREAYYYLGSVAMGQQVEDSQLLEIPLRPAWCKDCACLCAAEDILPLRDFENAYGAARAGKEIDYPLHSAFMDSEQVVSEVGHYLRWRMARRHAPRVLCCGGTNFQYLDVAQPLIKHAECDFGFIEGETLHIGPYCGPGPGVLSAANIRLYDSEGGLLGQLTWRRKETNGWDTEKLSYLTPTED
ncbi:hypothetical protein [Undibacterium umbellatum]|uniref:Uncharacterized protein n=1 Tax=Undibacterium umbellatum TaxID=2762300 RepID=A0ABR6Z886_9BURK|nr:hypothetical protein [Undibacterium umbellatum]MBC3908002.1 hypothetical protein [Undibacterium umbellatum]